MRRAWTVPFFVGLLLAAPLSACGGGDSKEDAKAEVDAGAGSSTTGGGEGEDSSSSTTATSLAYFDPDKATTTTAVPIDGSTSTTEFEIPSGGEPEELCAKWTAYEKEFAGQTVYEESSVSALKSLRPLLPVELRDDLDLVVSTYKKLVGMTVEETYASAVQEEIFVPAVQTSLYQLQTWGETVCGR